MSECFERLSEERRRKKPGKEEMKEERVGDDIILHN